MYMKCGLCVVDTATGFVQIYRHIFVLYFCFHCDDDDTIRRGEKEDPTTGADPRKLVGSRHHLRQSRTGLREQRIYFSIYLIFGFLHKK